MKIENKIDKYLNEVREPGQGESSEGINKFCINVKTQEQSKKLQEFLFKNGFKWSSGSTKFNEYPIKSYKQKTILAIDFEDKDILYGDTDYHKTQDGIRSYENIYSYDDFMSMMMDDERIKYKG